MEEPVANPQINERTFWLVNGELRLPWKLAAFGAVDLFLALAISVAVFFIPTGDFQDHAFVAASLLAVVAATALGQIAIERQPLSGVGLSRSSAEGGLLGGIAFGFLLICLAVATMAAGGGIHISVNSGDAGMLAWILFDGLLLYTLVSFSEELLMRGYPFQQMQKRMGNVFALLFTSVLFSLLHASNPNVTWASLANIFLAGLLLGSAYLATGSLWFPIGVHFGWNFMQGTVFGLPVSGIIRESILIVSPSGPAGLTGGAFGPEGGIAATVVLLAGTFALWFPPFIRLLPGNPVPGFGVSRIRKETDTE